MALELTRMEREVQLWGFPQSITAWVSEVRGAEPLLAAF
jgi:hypothetical protein